MYFSHGWNLALTEGEPLIYEPILAWKYGPVIQSIYDEFKFFRDRPINRFGTKTSGPFSLVDKEICPKVEDDYDLALLDKIWEVYGVSSGLYLSKITHSPGSPWDKKYNDFQNGKTYDDVISNEEIKNYFIDQMEQKG